MVINGKTNECTSLVVYDNSKVPLARFKDKEQEVFIGEHNVVLQQDWDQGGVAGVLWDSAVILSEYLLKKDHLNGKRVLELGAGLGLPSIIAAKAGAVQVTTTDQESGLRLLEANLKTNLDSSTLSRVLLQELNWSSPTSFSTPFDLVIGADLVYNKDVFAALQTTLLHFVQKDTLCLMASKIRYPKDRKFYSSLAKEFNVEQVHYDPATDVTLFEIRVKS